MELADRTLMDRFREARNEGLPGVPRDELLDYFREAAKGIDYLNEPRHTVGGKERVGIQHRDIKPQNILLVGGGVTVADFGLARFLESTVGSHSGSMTPAYAPPEFFKGQTSNQSDQYSLAVTYCQLRGGLPFSGTHEQIVVGHLMHPPDLNMLAEEERPAVARALAKEPGERWPSCRAFVQALAGRAVDERAHTLAPMPISPKAETQPGSKERTESYPPRRSRRGLTVAVLAGALAVAGVILWASGAFTPDPTSQEANRPQAKSQDVEKKAQLAQGDVAGGKENKPVAGQPEQIVPAKPEPKKQLPALKLLAPPSVTVKAGSKAKFEVKVERTALEGAVQVSFENLRPKVTVQPVTIPADRDTVEVVLDAAADASPGEQTLRLVVAGGEVNGAAELRLVVGKASKLTLQLPEKLELYAGEAKDLPIKVVRDGFEDPVEIDFFGLPRDVSSNRSSRGVASDSDATTVNLRAAASAVEVNKEVQVTGTAGAIRAEGRFQLIIRMPKITLHVPEKVDLQSGQKKRFTVEVTRRDYDGPITLQFRGLPQKVMIEETLIRSGESQASVLVSADMDAESDSQVVSVVALHGGAKAEAQLSLTAMPSPVAAALKRGELCLLTGKPDQAIDEFTEVLRLDPRNSTAYTMRGNAYREKKDYGRAERDCDEAIRLNPKDDVAYANRGRSHLDRGHLGRAIADLTDAIRINPDSDSHYGLRGNAYLRWPLYERGIEDLSTAIRINPKNFGYYVARAYAYEKLGRFEESKRDSETTKELMKRLSK